MTELAYLECDGITYYARQTPTPRAPTSAIVKLIQGIYARDPEQARRIVRNRIYSTAAPTEMCWGMIKLAARRITAPISTPEHVLQNTSAIEIAALAQPTDTHNPLQLWTGSSAPESVNDFMGLARALAAGIPREGPLYECDRPIAALLVSKDGETLSWGVNHSAKNKTLHAEVNMVQSYFQRTGRTLPRDARIFTTLKSCRMCAGMIWHCSEDVTTLKIYYGEFDPGPNARETILNARSLERRRVCLADPLVDLDLELEHATQ